MKPASPLLHAALALVLVSPLPLFAQGGTGTVSIRQVVASAQPGDSDPALDDVLPLLRRNLRYNSYRQATAATAALRSGTQVPLRMGYHLELVDVSDNELTVRVAKRREVLLNTRLALRPGKPIVLGGFSEGENTLLIVLLYQNGE